MKESIGNSFVFGVFIIFAFLTLLILTFAINYTRANKIKNRLVNYVETYAENELSSNDGDVYFLDNQQFLTDVDLLLSKVGYKPKDGINRYQTSCTTDQKKIGNGILMSNYSTNYDYCIYAYPTSRGYFYKIVTYMYLEIPIIGTQLKFPISGETRTIYSLGTR